MHSIKTQITDAAIKRNSKEQIKQISDPQYPIKFRYSKCRKKGSWFVVINKSGKSIWRKVGQHPALNREKLIKRLPEIMAELAINANSNAITVGRFETVNNLITWYVERSETARFLSEKRRCAIKSIANKHVVSKLGSIKIKDLDHEKVDSQLIVVMQNQYSLAYTRQVYDILRLAFKQAQKLRLIDYNPIAGLKFTDFITAPIKPKQGKLTAKNIIKLNSQFEKSEYQAKTLAMLMLLHGTRIGETRATRWDWVDWNDNSLLIPLESTKTKQAHKIPLTDFAIEMLKGYRQKQESKDYKGTYMFPNGHGNNIGETKANNYIKSVSNGDWTAHDLRKLARTCWLDLDIDYFIGELLLNHKMSKLDSTYIHTHAEKQKRDGLNKYHSWLKNNGFNKLLFN